MLGIVTNIQARDFELEDLKYDGGQYQYYIDRYFKPKQNPGIAQLEPLKLVNYERILSVFMMVLMSLPIKT